LANPIKVEQLKGKRLLLEPLRQTHAREMAAILSDPVIYEFIGGTPMSAARVRSQYKRLEAGSPNPSEKWLNWVIRYQAQDALVGSLQATVWPEQAQAEVAWIVGTPWQGQGIASEAAAQVVQWLRRQGIRLVIAHIHPDHRASQAVARHIGLTPTVKMVDGEVEWQAELV